MAPKRIGLVGNPTTWHSQQLQAAFEKRGLLPIFTSCTRLRALLGAENRVVSGEETWSDLDLVLVREVNGGSLEQVIYRMDALHQLEDSGVIVLNRPGAIEKMVDKYYALSLLAQAGLTIPETIVTEDAAEALHAFEALGGDVVLKPLFGSRGIGMVRLSEREIAYRSFRALELGHYVYYLQRYVPCRGYDLRVLVIGQQCQAVSERHASQWRKNISQGGIARACELTPEIAESSLRAAQALGADYCGVDLLPGEDGRLYCLEVNSMPAWSGLQSVCPQNLADALVDYCIQKIGGD